MDPKEFKDQCTKLERWLDDADQWKANGEPCDTVYFDGEDFDFYYSDEDRPPFAPTLIADCTESIVWKKDECWIILNTGDKYCFSTYSLTKRSAPDA